MLDNMEYTVAIRTLGTAGEKYQQLLDSLDCQTIPPKEIIVYIAEGYALPKETIGKERYVYVKKGMVAQRALKYEEVDTKYILFLDDDVYLPENAVEIMYDYLIENKADVISPDVFPNAERSFWGKCMMMISGRMMARKNDGKWGYKVMRNAGYSYNKKPDKDIYLSQTNAGPCFFCSKECFLNVRFEEELWLDKLTYALGEDQIMFYKMYKLGMKQLTLFHSGIEHLDSGSTMKNLEKVKTLIYSDFYFKTIFWHRFIYLPEKYMVMRWWDMVCIGYTFAFALGISLIKARFDIFKIKMMAIREAVAFLKSEEYCSLSKLNNRKNK